MKHKKIDYPNELNIIFEKLNKNGIKVILIGGFVRDKLLKINSKDIDIELFNLESLNLLEKILKEFGNVNSVGKSFGVCKLKYKGLDLDFSLPRSDSKYSKGHKGFEVKIDSSLDFKTAASRRDFSMNAIGYDIKEQCILDPFNGIGDLNNSLIKAVDLQKFIEDPLRVLRAIQFAARFGFSIDEALFSECKDMVKKGLLEELPKERIYTELEKLLLKSTLPSIGLRLAKELNIVNYFGDYNSLDRVDYFALHKTTDKKTNMLIFLTLLYADDSFKQIEKITSEVKLIKNVKIFLETRSNFSLENLSNYKIYKLATEVNIEIFSSYLSAFYLGKEDDKIKELKELANSLGVLTAKAPAFIQGRDIISLGLSPSKEFKKILDESYTAQIKEVFHTKGEALIWLRDRL